MMRLVNKTYSTGVQIMFLEERPEHVNPMLVSMLTGIYSENMQ